MQLICRYDVDYPDVIGHAPDGAVVSIDPAIASAIVVPFAGDTIEAVVKAFGKAGPAPQIMGDPPTKLRPSVEELIAEGVGRYVLGGDGEPLLDTEGHKVVHDLHKVAGTPYPDNRRLAEDLRLPAAPPESDKVTLTAYLGHVRWMAETAGITVDGVPVATDRTSQASVEKVGSRAARDPAFAPKFKGSDGAFHNVGNEGLVKIADAVSDHVQACFDAEASTLADIKAGKVTAFKGIDAAFAKLQPAEAAPAT